MEVDIQGILQYMISFVLIGFDLEAERNFEKTWWFYSCCIIIN